MRLQLIARAATLFLGTSIAIFLGACNGQVSIDGEDSSSPDRRHPVDAASGVSDSGPLEDSPARSDGDAATPADGREERADTATDATLMDGTPLDGSGDAGASDVLPDTAGATSWTVSIGVDYYDHGGAVTLNGTSSSPVGPYADSCGTTVIIAPKGADFTATVAPSDDAASDEAACGCDLFSCYCPPGSIVNLLPTGGPFTWQGNCTPHVAFELHGM